MKRPSASAEELHGFLVVAALGRRGWVRVIQVRRGDLGPTCLIGDCSGTRTVFDAMHDGAGIGEKI